MSKTDKELAVELACATLIAVALKSNSPKQINANDVHNIVTDCFKEIINLPDSQECN